MDIAVGTTFLSCIEAAINDMSVYFRLQAATSDFPFVLTSDTVISQVVVPRYPEHMRITIGMSLIPCIHKLRLRYTF